MPQVTPEERKKIAEESRKRLDDLKMGTEQAIQEYKEGRLELARLKRRIAQESRALNQPATDSDPASVIRRLESLESKVEQILQILAKGKG